MSKTVEKQFVHSPTPWAVGEDGWIDDASDGTVCMINSNGIESETEKADAALIIAAPDFQDAVRSLMIDLDETCPDCISIGTFDQLVSALAKSLKVD